ncbi:MAG: vitamin K epoxide reductase family protein [Holophagales bacterium]|nr:vitamin K epoxide reductase family protein [Holophagales bacterium]
MEPKRAARGAALALFGLLLAVQVPGSAVELAFAVLTLVGAGACVALERAGRGQLACAGCREALASPWARWGPWSLSGVGLAFFLAGAVLALAHPNTAGALGAGYLAASPVSALLLVGLLGSSRLGSSRLGSTRLGSTRLGSSRLCPLCLLVHGVVLTGAALAAVALPALGDWRIWWPWLALHALGMLAFLGWLLPGLEARFQVRFLEQRLGPVLDTPLGALALLAAGEPWVDAGETASWRRGPEQAPVPLELWVSSSCSACSSSLEHATELAERYPDLLGLRIRVVPRGDDAECAILLTALARIGGHDQALSAFRSIARELEAGDRAGAELAVAVADRACVPESRARDAVLEARREVADWQGTHGGKATGLPVVLVGGRLFPAPVSRLGTLLEQHRDLLVATLDSPTRPVVRVGSSG